MDLGEPSEIALPKSQKPQGLVRLAEREKDRGLSQSHVTYHPNGGVESSHRPFLEDPRLGKEGRAENRQKKENHERP